MSNENTKQTASDPFAPTAKAVRVYRIVGALCAEKEKHGAGAHVVEAVRDRLGATETELADAHRMMQFAVTEDYDRWARIVRNDDRKAADAPLYDSRTGRAS